MKLLTADSYIEDASTELSSVENGLNAVAKSLGITTPEKFLRLFLRSCAKLHSCHDFDDLRALTQDFDEDAGGEFRIFADRHGLVHGVRLFPELEVLGEEVAVLCTFCLQPQMAKRPNR